MMTKYFLSAAVILACCGTVQARTGHHHYAKHTVGGHSRHVFYGVGNGGQTPRTTATGGNPGGYSNKN